MPQRELQLATIDDVIVEVHRLHEHGYEKTGQWDLAQICEHCARPARFSIEGFPFKVPPPIRWLVSLLMKKGLFRKRRIRAGLPAPRSLRPAPERDEAAAIAALEEAFGRFREHVRSGGELKLHPAFGKFSAEQWEQFLIIHTAHHLSFLQPTK